MRKKWSIDKKTPFKFGKMEVTKPSKISKQKGDTSMIHQNNLSEKSQNSFSQIFSTLKVSQMLRQAGIRKSYGFSSFAVFQILFQMVFQGLCLLQLLQSKRGEDLPHKDVYYRFLNDPKFNWRKFYQLLCLKVVGFFETLTSAKRIRVFIIDDSPLSRDRSKKVELLARVYDHVEKKFIRGFQLLTLGWSDGFSFVPLDFALMSSAKQENRYQPMNEDIDRRSCGSKRRQEAMLEKPMVALQMLQRILLLGIRADYILMDSWFALMPLVENILSHGLHVIGRLKELKQRYIYHGRALSLSELYKAIPKKTKEEILGSVLVESKSGICLKIVFVQNRNKRKEWLAILSTDVALEDAEVVRIYGMRWSIEPFHKAAKSLLQLGKEFQGRSYDLLISHTTIVYTRYLVLEFERRNNNDERTFGGMFYLFCDEVKDIDLMTALRQLMIFAFSMLTKIPNQDALNCQVIEWIKQLPNYIKALWPISLCET